jgi:hypothetical protein
MKTRFFAGLLSLFAALPGLAGAQEYNIVGDTIKVSGSAFPLLSFMGEIREAQPLCSDYRLAPSTTTLTIRPNVSKPVKVCRLLVSEGSKSSPRQHQFVLVFDKDADPAEQIHDYSTKDLIERRVEYLEKMRKANGGGGDEEPVAKKGKKGKKAKEKEKGDDGDLASAAGDAAKNAKVPDVEAPEVKTPKFGKTPKTPEVKTPDVKKPDVKKPDVKKPDLKKPDIANAKRTASSEGDEEDPTETAGSRSSNAKTPVGSDDEDGEDQGDIRNIPNDLIEGRVKQKVKAFYKACELLCTKTDVDATIKYGMKLFDNNEDALVETTNSKSGDKSSKKIRQYFTHLSQLSYKKVEMTASDIKFVSKFHLGPDKKWHASAVIIQDFKGFRDNAVVYKDLTNKTIDIIINTFEEEKDGQTVTKFEIYLGNISVTNIPS